jgi:hypothetical protein
MKLSTRTLALTAALAMSAVPAFALPPQVPSNQGTAHIPDNQGTQRAPDNPGPPAGRGPQAGGDATPAPTASPSAKAKAYGRYCADQSKKHVAGSKGTPFSTCVTAMAKLATEQTTSPRAACTAESKKHVAGQKGTPFSRCVSAGAKLLHDQAAAETPAA